MDMPTPETLAAAVAQTAILLGIDPPPAGTQAADLRAWLDWWKPSADVAARLTPSQVASLKAGRWWPPVTAHQVNTMGPGRIQLFPETKAKLEAKQAVELRIQEHNKRRHTPPDE